MLFVGCLLGVESKGGGKKRVEGGKKKRIVIIIIIKSTVNEVAVLVPEGHEWLVELVGWVRWVWFGWLVGWLVGEEGRKEGRWNKGEEKQRTSFVE